ncbi:hypothetical protein [Catellatospora sp. NPDC049609]|uniref:hypothetical protein n=1 Tax=Catellatospora sp. NPDC049609 TaxID=3155505 RepID=UPI0034125C80
MSLSTCVRVATRAKAVWRQCCGCTNWWPLRTGEDRCGGCTAALKRRVRSWR